MNPAADPGGPEAGWLERVEALRAACEGWGAAAPQDAWPGLSHHVGSAAVRRARARALCREVLSLATPEGDLPCGASPPGLLATDPPELDSATVDAALAAREAWQALCDLATEVLVRPPDSDLHDARIRVLCRYAERCARLQREACRVMAGAERPTAPA